MKLKGKALLACTLAAMMLAACGGQQDTEETAESVTEAQTETGDTGETGETVDPAYEELQEEIAAVSPERPDSLGEVELGEYMGITVDTEAPAQISSDDALLFIEENVLPNYLEETDEPAQEGFTVNIDFVGKMDGVAFDGGTAEDQTFVLGNGGYIEGFESGIVGMKAGETRDINVTFPEEYTEELAGKDAVFTITMNSVQKERALDDTLAHELNADCDTRDEYIEFVRGELQSQEDMNAEFGLYDAAVEQVIAGSPLVEPSEDAVNWRMDEMILADNNMLSSAYGISLADYISIYGSDLDDYRDSIRETCEDQARQYLVTEAICDAEGLEATDEALEEWASVNGVTMEDVNAAYDADEAAIRCRAWLAARLVAENAQVNYMTGEELSEQESAESAQ